MKIIKAGLKVVSLALVMGLISFMCSTVSYAGALEEYQERVRDGSAIPNPGYLRVDKGRTYGFKEAVKPNQKFFDKAVQYIKSKLANQLAEPTTERVIPNLQKKSSDEVSSDPTTTTTSFISPTGTLDLGIDYDVDIGSGDAAYQYWDDGRLMWEYIGGLKHIYVGFAGVGYASDGTTSALQDAIDIADGRDVIIVSAGTYTGDLTITSDVRLYGGYDASGERDIDNNTTAISGDITVSSTTRASSGAVELAELNGFLMKDGSEITVSGGRFALMENLYEANTKVTNLSFTWLDRTGDVDWPASIVAAGGVFAFNSTPADIGVTNVGEARSETVTVDTPATADDLVKNLGQDALDKNPQSLMYEMPGKGGGFTSTATLNNFGNGENMLGHMMKEMDPELLQEAMKEMMNEGVLNLPMSEMSPEDIQTLIALANIMNNLTPEQKAMLDAIEAILKEAEKLQEENQDEELEGIMNDFTRTIAALFMAHALPDLLQGDEITIVNGLFQELDTKKTEILRDYELSTKAFYTSIVKELSASMATLQVDDIFGKSLSEVELTKLPSHRIDAILKKIRNLKDKTTAEETLLAKSDIYKEMYIDPAKKELEKNMKLLLEGFTHKLLNVLENTNPAKEGSLSLKIKEE